MDKASFPPLDHREEKSHVLVGHGMGLLMLALTRISTTSVQMTCGHPLTSLLRLGLKHGPVLHFLLTKKQRPQTPASRLQSKRKGIQSKLGCPQCWEGSGSGYVAHIIQLLTSYSPWEVVQPVPAHEAGLQSQDRLLMRPGHSPVYDWSYGS